MKDPLSDYDWTNLYHDYDPLCENNYDRNSIYLEYFSRKPATDRDCYNCISKEMKIIFESIKKDPNQNFPIKLLIAIFYWKLYSQPAAVKNICHRLYYDNTVQEISEDEFNKFIKNIPGSITKNIKEIVKLILNFNNYSIRGVKTNTSIPVRTAILHFIYPNEVSIFDKMVLRAVGIFDKNSNQNINVFKEYQQFAWDLANKYNKHIINYSEPPLRVIDMGLWINRGA